MPNAWNYATLNNLIVGNNRLSVKYTKTQNRVRCIIRSAEPDWKIHFVVGKNTSNIFLNNKTTKSNKQQVELTGIDNTIEYTIN